MEVGETKRIITTKRARVLTYEPGVCLICRFIVEGDNSNAYWNQAFLLLEAESIQLYTFASGWWGAIQIYVPLITWSTAIYRY